MRERTLSANLFNSNIIWRLPVQTNVLVISDVTSFILEDYSRKLEEKYGVGEDIPTIEI
jgi:hypothetical protein